MNLGEAIAIFKNIERCPRSDDEKKAAIKAVIGMETNNSITKKDILNALVWLYETTIEL